MDKGLTVVPKWVLKVQSKIIAQMPQNLSAQIVCPSPKVWDFNEKRLYWASVVRAAKQQLKLLATASRVPRCGNKKNPKVFFFITHDIFMHSHCM